VARERGGALGEEVGYRVRFEERGGPRTRRWFVTEGVFGRLLAADPFLERVGVVVLDELHERHLQGDVALAVVREVQETVRPDLRLAVMSATLETDALARALGDAAVLTAEGRAFPVAIEYDEEASVERHLATRVARALRRVLGDPGDVLVFLPGAAEIRRAAADQRAGRAGRLAPGRCLRLWSRAEHAGRRPAETPEVLRLDLTRVVLELHAWALADAHLLRWLDPPPPHAIERAERLLTQLGALESVGGAVTPTGRRVLALPAEPRLARMLVEAERTGAGP